MRHDVRVWTAIAAMVAAFVALPTLSAQTTSSSSASKKWRTQWGAPDLQGMWTFVDEVMTPLEKPSGDIKLMETVRDAELELRRRRDQSDKGIGNPEHWSELRPLTSVKWLVREKVKINGPPVSYMQGDRSPANQSKILAHHFKQRE